MKKYEFKGKHILIDLHNIKDINICTIKKEIDLLSSKYNFNIINSEYHIFDNGGFTIIFLLKESHISIHYYKEFNSMFLDFFTCGIIIDNDLLLSDILNIFKPSLYTINSMKRGI